MNKVTGSQQSNSEKPYVSTDMSKGTWDYPFTQLAGRKKTSQPGLFIGMKMYTPQGYRPLDDKCTCLSDFYQKCEDEQIPILNHCSAGGNTIPENRYYMEHIHGSMGNAGSSDSDATSVRISNLEDPYTYFNNNFVHPRAWRSVLSKYKNLRLCLAHFGAAEWNKGHMQSDWIEEMIALMEEFPNV
jgi:predicted TIM-barrel fold metal-dependent hydrolase